MRRHLLAFFLAAAALLAPLHAKAGIPVIDVTAVANLMQQVMYWQQQISAMQRQYEQLKASKDQLALTYGAMTGTRGMEQLLPTSDLARNYLPPSYGELMNTLNGSSPSYAGLANHVQSIMRANSVLSGGQMDALSPEMRQIVEQGRQSAAMLNGMTHSAYQNTSQRFSALQQLINRIATAHTPRPSRTCRRGSRLSRTCSPMSRQNCRVFIRSRRPKKLPSSSALGNKSSPVTAGSAPGSFPAPDSPCPNQPSSSSSP